MELEWWHWMIGGIALIAAELIVPSFVLIWFGAGAIVVALLTSIAVIGLTAQLVIWLVVSTALVFGWFRVYKKDAHKTRIGTADADVIGEVGLLTKSVAPFEHGEVRFQKPILGADTWACVADEAIPAGERVCVRAVEGNFMKIRRI